MRSRPVVGQWPEHFMRSGGLGNYGRHLFLVSFFGCAPQVRLRSPFF
ncbi:MAG: hypothetical protein JWR21_4366 [Herminiimonas sp.]|nr:hypothetical protein [Herminiimonas sp.]